MLVLAVAAYTATAGDGSPARGPESGGKVVRVVDGDTIHVQVGGRDETVRYIGVDTPESVKPGTPVQCFAKRASAFNERLVAGERVRLVPDAEARDRYGRLLAYVYRDRDGAVRQRRAGPARLRGSADDPAQRGPRGRLPAPGRVGPPEGAWPVVILPIVIRSKAWQCGCAKAWPTSRPPSSRRSTPIASAVSGSRRRRSGGRSIRHRERAKKHGSLRFWLVLLTLIATAVIVTIAMFETLYYVMG